MLRRILARGRITQRRQGRRVRNGSYPAREQRTEDDAAEARLRRRGRTAVQTTTAIAVHTPPKPAAEARKVTSRRSLPPRQAIRATRARVPVKSSPAMTGVVRRSKVVSGEVEGRPQCGRPAPATQGRTSWAPLRLCRSDAPPPAWDQPTVIVLGSRKASRPITPNSRPCPDSFTPPNGASRSGATRLTSTVPVSIRPATRRARASSAENT